MAAGIHAAFSADCRTAMCLQALLSSPQPDDPQDAVVALQLISDNEARTSTAKQSTAALAILEAMAPEEKVRCLALTLRGLCLFLCANWTN